jgi:hypothetical protein
MTEENNRFTYEQLREALKEIEEVVHYRIVVSALADPWFVGRNGRTFYLGAKSWNTLVERADHEVGVGAFMGNVVEFIPENWRP